MSVTLKGFDAARAELMKQLKDFQTDAFVTVGIHEDEGAHDGTTITNAQIGVIHEYGATIKHENTGTETVIPARPWLVPGVESGFEEYGEIIEDEIKNGATLKEALEIVGNVAVGNVKTYMTELKEPALVSRDGNPLVKTGELRASVTYEVSDTKPTEGL